LRLGKKLVTEGLDPDLLSYKNIDQASDIGKECGFQTLDRLPLPVFVIHLTD
jgi:hypothetical protein